MDSKPKNIFFLSDNFPPERNAAASRVSERGLYWTKKGHSLTVLTSFPNFPEGKIHEGYKNCWFQKEDFNGIDVARVKTFIAPNRGFILRVVDFLSYMATSFVAGLFLIKKEHDVIIATSPQLFTAVSAWALAKVKGKPFIFELGDLWPESIKAVGAIRKSLLLRYIEKLELFLYREAKIIVALTEAFKCNLVARGINPDKIFVVRNGADISKHQRKPPNEELRRSLGLEGKFVVGYIGTLGMAHDLRRVIEVASILQLRGKSKIVFLFVGSGADRENLETLVSRSRLDNVIFVDSQPKEIIGDYWGLLDMALVHVRNSGTFGGVIPSKMFEAMAYGCPVLLIAPEGEAVEIIRSSQAGYCLTDYSLETFADALSKLSSDTEWLKYTSAKALESVQNFTRQRQADEFLEVLNHLS